VDLTSQRKEFLISSTFLEFSGESFMARNFGHTRSALLLTSLLIGCCAFRPIAAFAGAAVDVCKITTKEDAVAILGSLPPQPPIETDHAGFGIDACMFLGPALSGAGAQTVFSSLHVQVGKGKDASDMLGDDAEKRKATFDLPNVGEAAKRNAQGSFVWARQGDIVCAAEIKNGLPKGLTADSAPTKLGALCRKIFAVVKP
jgi:hypothetical protein